MWLSELYLWLGRFWLIDIFLVITISSIIDHKRFFWVCYEKFWKPRISFFGDSLTPKIPQNPKWVAET
jgi:hypothetical protein